MHVVTTAITCNIKRVTARAIAVITATITLGRTLHNIFKLSVSISEFFANQHGILLFFNFLSKSRARRDSLAVITIPIKLS